MEVMNHDIAGYIRRLDRFIVELHKSASANVSEMSVFDQDRLEKYLDALVVYKATTEGLPQLDLPETHRPIALGEEPAAELVENESVNDVIRLLKVLRGELISSQSARVTSGYVIHDSKRVDSVINKAKDFLQKYIRVATPLDLPDSSPMREFSK